MNIGRYEGGAWSETGDEIAAEEPLQLLLDGEPLSVIMRTPGNDIELAMGLLHAERVITKLSVPFGAPLQRSGGDSLPPLQPKSFNVYLSGNFAPSSESALPRTKAAAGAAATRATGAIEINALRALPTRARKPPHFNLQIPTHFPFTNVHCHWCSYATQA